MQRIFHSILIHLGSLATVMAYSESDIRVVRCREVPARPIETKVYLDASRVDFGVSFVIYRITDVRDQSSRDREVFVYKSMSRTDSIEIAPPESSDSINSHAFQMIVLDVFYLRFKSIADDIRYGNSREDVGLVIGLSDEYGSGEMHIGFEANSIKRFSRCLEINRLNSKMPNEGLKFDLDCHYVISVDGPFSQGNPELVLTDDDLFDLGLCRNAKTSVLIDENVHNDRVLINRVTCGSRVRYYLCTQLLSDFLNGDVIVTRGLVGNDEIRYVMGYFHSRIRSAIIDLRNGRKRYDLNAAGFSTSRSTDSDARLLELQLLRLEVVMHSVLQWKSRRPVGPRGKR